MGATVRLLWRVWVPTGGRRCVLEVEGPALAPTWRAVPPARVRRGDGSEAVDLGDREHAYAPATAHPSVTGLAFGAADLAAELGTAHRDVLDAAAHRVMLAAAAGRLPRPPMSVFPVVRDLDGPARPSAVGWLVSCESAGPPVDSHPDQLARSVWY
ncbi:hypothetical protein ABZ389_33340, partial [Streptomyces sp. NPDC005877]